MATNFLKKSSGRRVTVAAAAFAACLTMSPMVFAQSSYSGADNVSAAGQFGTNLTTDYEVGNGNTFDATGGGALPPGATPTGSYYGEGALHVDGSFTNRGTAQIIGGDAGNPSNFVNVGQSGLGGAGVEVTGDIHNYNSLDVTGGRSENSSANSIPLSYGGTGLKAANGTLFNHAGTITAAGGIGWNHSGRGGVAIEVKDLVNSAILNTVGGYSTMDVTGGGGFPMGGDGINVNDTIVNNVGGIITATGGEGDMHTSCTHAGMGGNGLVVGGIGSNYGILNGFGGTASNQSSGTSSGGIGMVYGGLVTNYESGQVLAKGGVPNSVGSSARRGGTGINFTGGIVNYSDSFRAEGASPTNSSASLATGGMGITVGPEQFWTTLSNATFDFKVENYGTIEAIGGVGSTTGSGVGVTGGDGMGVASYFWYNDVYSMTNVNLIAEVVNKGTIIATGGDAESTNASAATGGKGFTLGGGTVRTGMTLTVNSTSNYGVMVASGGDARSTGTGSSTGGWGMKLVGGTYNYGEMTARGGLQLSGGGSGTETGGVGMILEDGLTNYEGSYLTLLGSRSSTYANGAHAVQLGGTALGIGDDLPHGAWFKKGSFLSLGNADYAAGLASGASINANGLNVVFENDDPTWPEAMIISPATSALGVGGKVTHTDFIVNTASDWGTGAGQIGVASYTGPVMDVSITQTPNGGNFNYTYEATRVAWSSNYLAGSSVADYFANLERQIAGVTIDESNYHWANVLASVDFQPGIQRLRDQANYVFNATMSPYTPQAMQSLARAGRITDSMFSRNLQSLGKNGYGSDWAVPVCSATEYYYGTAEGPDSCEQYCRPAWLWLQPFYFAGTQKGLSNAFGDLDESYAGVNLGYAQDLGPVVLSISGHYYSGDLKADKSRQYDGDVDGYGLEVGLGRMFQISETWNPWVELRAGYTRLDLEQTRWDFNGDRVSSDPNADMFYAGLKVNNDFHVSDRVTLTPSLGLDYLHLKMVSYREKGNSGLLLNVKPENYDSFRGVLGLDATFQATDDLYLKLRGAYNYEFGDRNAETMVQARALNAFKNRVSDDEYSRHSGAVGAGIGYVFCNEASIGLDYDATFADKYVGHQVTGRLVFSF